MRAPYYLDRVPLRLCDFALRNNPSSTFTVPLCLWVELFFYTPSAMTTAGTKGRALASTAEAMPQAARRST